MENVMDYYVRIDTRIHELVLGFSISTQAQ
ncbi:unannotated protein [freshwater metagenome]|uniref:Unannotated protein n=1 Tax=freshwater metagenome TaxID=449393 RepID=A0A6J7VFQ0_9ZZZZ